MKIKSFSSFNEEKKWIKDAIKNPGSLKKSLGKEEGEKLLKREDLRDPEIVGELKTMYRGQALGKRESMNEAATDRFLQSVARNLAKQMRGKSASRTVLMNRLNSMPLANMLKKDELEKVADYTMEEMGLTEKSDEGKGRASETPKGKDVKGEYMTGPTKKDRELMKREIDKHAKKDATKKRRLELAKTLSSLKENHDGGVQNYMFFSNLKTIKRLVDEMLEMDEAEVDTMLTNGHNWALDHIATSKDDVEEVFNFLAGEQEEKPVLGSPESSHTVHDRTSPKWDGIATEQGEPTY